MLKINPKAFASFVRHLKSSAVMGLLAPLVLATVKQFQTQGFKLGFNVPTVVVLGLAVLVAGVTVGGGILLKKRPDLAPEITFVEKKVLDELNVLASTQIVSSEVTKVTTHQEPDRTNPSVTTEVTTVKPVVAVAPSA